MNYLNLIYIFLLGINKLFLKFYYINKLCIFLYFKAIYTYCLVRNFSTSILPSPACNEILLSKGDSLEPKLTHSDRSPLIPTCCKFIFNF